MMVVIIAVPACLVKGGYNPLVSERLRGPGKWFRSPDPFDRLCALPRGQNRS
jgi:hypothetical protein